MVTMASQITSLTIVYLTVYSGADQRKHLSSTSLPFVRGIHRWPVNSPYKGPVRQKMFPLMTSSWFGCNAIYMLCSTIHVSLLSKWRQHGGCRWPGTNSVPGHLQPSWWQWLGKSKKEARMVVADGLASIWCQDICNHQDDIGWGNQYTVTKYYATWIFPTEIMTCNWN